jgi:UDP-N-acetylmuramate dehydrogenase
MSARFGFPGSWIRENAALESLCTFRTGGRAAILFEPPNVPALCEGLREFARRNIPVAVLGGGSNMLVSDRGFEGAVIRLRKGAFVRIEREGTIIRCGAGVRSRSLSRFALDLGIRGFEFLCVIPGTVGGAVAGNAGRCGQSIAETLVELETVTRTGTPRRIVPGPGRFETHRFKGLGAHIVTRAVFEASYGGRAQVESCMRRFREHKNGNDPRGRSAGSVFRNPPGLRAWELIDRMGFRGRRLGGARVSPGHPNWIVAGPGATSTEIWKLISRIRGEARKRFGIELELEIRLLGDFDPVEGPVRKRAKVKK